MPDRIDTTASGDWETGLESFQSGDSSIAGLTKIWKAMKPPGDLDLAARIAAALWADTYWKSTRMSRRALAADIEDATGIRRPDSAKAAQKAFSSWLGLFVRGNLEATAAIPRADPATRSPDVVVSGTTPLTVDQLIRRWNQTFTPRLLNYAYGRAQSVGIGVPIQKPTLGMYSTDAGFNHPPTSWIRLYTYEGSSATSPLETLAGPGAPIGVSQRAASSRAFQFGPPGSGDYSVLTVAKTEFFANDPTAASGNWDSQEWIHHNGAAGWRNLSVPARAEALLRFHNQDASAEDFVFEAWCRDLPPGTMVSLACEDLAIESSRKVFDALVVVRLESRLPPLYGGDLNVRFETPDRRPLPAGSAVEVRCFWRLPAAHRHYPQAAEQLQVDLSRAPREALRVEIGSFTFLGR